MTNPAYEATNSDVVLHMDEATHVFDALKTELISNDVLNEHLGPMGATAVEVWSAKTGQTLTMHHAMGGCSLYIHTPNTNGMMQLSNELAEMKLGKLEVKLPDWWANEYMEKCLYYKDVVECIETYGITVEKGGE